jgi:dTDP-4-dehydrorhamnose reductase
MIRAGRERGLLRVIADQRMSPTSTADVARMILDALRRRIPPGTYHAVNTSGPTGASWFEFASRIVERAGVGATVEPIPASAYPLPAQRPAFSALDNSKLAALVGPIPHWHDALDRYLAEKGHRRH